MVDKDGGGQGIGRADAVLYDLSVDVGKNLRRVGNRVASGKYSVVCNRCGCSDIEFSQNDTSSTQRPSVDGNQCIPLVLLERS